MHNTDNPLINALSSDTRLSIQQLLPSTGDEIAMTTAEIAEEMHSLDMVCAPQYICPWNDEGQVSFHRRYNDRVMFNVCGDEADIEALIDVYAMLNAQYPVIALHPYAPATPALDLLRAAPSTARAVRGLLAGVHERGVRIEPPLEPGEPFDGLSDDAHIEAWAARRLSAGESPNAVDHAAQSAKRTLEASRDVRGRIRQLFEGPLADEEPDVEHIFAELCSVAQDARRADPYGRQTSRALASALELVRSEIDRKDIESIHEQRFKHRAMEHARLTGWQISAAVKDETLAVVPFPLRMLPFDNEASLPKDRPVYFLDAQSIVRDAQERDPQTRSSAGGQMKARLEALLEYRQHTQAQATKKTAARRRGTPTP